MSVRQIADTDCASGTKKIPSVLEHRPTIVVARFCLFNGPSRGRKVGAGSDQFFLGEKNDLHLRQTPIPICQTTVN